MSLPPEFKVEYARTGTSECRNCKTKIDADVLRLAQIFQSDDWDGDRDFWHHHTCFFEIHHAASITEIKGSGNIRWSDQEFLKSAIERLNSPSTSASPQNSLKRRSFPSPQFTIGYASSDHSECIDCDSSILEGSIQIKQIDEDSRMGLVHKDVRHLDCFQRTREYSNFYSSAETIQNFEELTDDDKKIVKLKLPQIENSNGPSPAKRAKTYILNLQEEEKMKEQTEKLFKLRDKLGTLHKKDWKALLNHNNQFIPSGKSPILDELCDRMLFGSLMKCKKCAGDFYFVSGVGYKCEGNYAEDIKCNEIANNPERIEFEIPEDLKKREPLKTYKSIVSRRIFRKTHEPKIMNKFVEKINRERIASENIIDEARDNGALFDKETISSHSNYSNIMISTEDRETSSKSGTFEMDQSHEIKLKLKRGGIVHPESGLADVAHIFEDEGGKYAVRLSKTIIEQNKNSSYHLQVLKHDTEERFHLFKKWERTGTKRGGNSCKEIVKAKCIEEFKNTFFEKTRHYWHDRKNFEATDGYWTLLENNADEDIDESDLKIHSKLKKPVQDLMKLIFNDNGSEEVIEYLLDTRKFPLGRISKKQLLEADGVLENIRELLSQGCQNTENFIDLSNKFYTLVPQSFGNDQPPIIDNYEELEERCEKLNSLIQMEFTYSITKEKRDNTKSRIDSYYERLNTDIDVLDRESDEFKMIEEYATNSHSKIHENIKLKIEDVFVIRRHGEEERYEPFKKWGNRKLLWHGSRLTNFVGILSKGLRIAPPEAEKNDHMFGKGIYFADMVSKSTKYCCATRENPTGLFLLCEVALGKMFEDSAGKDIKKLPKNYDSVWGVGQAIPDPGEAYKTSDGVEVPYGREITNDRSPTPLLYHNEFTVYNDAQVKMKYLVRMNIQMKSWE